LFASPFLSRSTLLFKPIYLVEGIEELDAGTLGLGFWSVDLLGFCYMDLFGFCSGGLLICYMDLLGFCSAGLLICYVDLFSFCYWGLLGWVGGTTFGCSIDLFGFWVGFLAYYTGLVD